MSAVMVYPVHDNPSKIFRLILTNTDTCDLLWMKITDKFGIRCHKQKSQSCLCLYLGLLINFSLLTNQIASESRC